MASDLVFGSGDSRMTVSPAVQECADRMLREAAPRGMRTLRRVTTELKDAAAERWPVDTGTSKAGLGTMIRVSGDALVEGIVFNRVPYAYKITVPGGTAATSGTFGPMTQQAVLRAAGWNKRDHVWSELVRKPGEKRATEIAQALVEDMQQIAEGR
jgi:hypothetical protein